MAIDAVRPVDETASAVCSVDSVGETFPAHPIADAIATSGAMYDMVRYTDRVLMVARSPCVFPHAVLVLSKGRAEASFLAEPSPRRYRYRIFPEISEPD
jgi:hypothetical protein